MCAALLELWVLSLADQVKRLTCSVPLNDKRKKFVDLCILLFSYTYTLCIMK